MVDWLTSDTHFGHANILRYCPWRQTWASSIEEHDALLIEAWNRTVQPDDTVYHLGDFALMKRDAIGELRQKLHGRIVLVKGNHDRSGMVARGFEVVPVVHLAVGALNTCMRHMPESFRVEDWNAADLLLHGHTHGDDHRSSSGVPPEHQHKLIDCGIDARRNIEPVRLIELCGAARP